MLKQEDRLETQPQHAAKVRVTPEELAAAIARLEARKDADSRQVDGTIPIGEAVQQLGLEATPEEVLAEVEAGRRQAVPQKKRTVPGQRLVLALGLAGLLLGAVIDGNALFQSQHNHSNGAYNVVYIPQKISLTPDLLVSDASGNLVTFSTVKDNQPVQCNLLESNNQLRFYQWTPSNTAQNSWTLIKHGGRVYVRGWIADTSPDVLETSGASVFPHQIQPSEMVPITLPLQGFQATPGSDNGAWFHATNIHLDKHANDPGERTGDERQP